MAALLTIGEAAAMLGCSEALVRLSAQLEEGTLDAVVIGERSKRITAESVDRALMYGVYEPRETAA